MSLDFTSLAAPISLRPAVTLTDEELMRFSEDNKPYRIERNNCGEVIVMTPVDGIGSTHEAYVAASLFQWNETMKTGVAFLSNAGFNLSDGSCLSPDAAWVSLARWNALTSDEQAGYPPLCPEFVIEVRSRTDSRRVLEEKMRLWLDNGAKLAWLIDLVNVSATIYQPGNQEQTLARPSVVTAVDLVAGFELRTERLWPVL